jgi:hypothetical protein
MTKPQEKNASIVNKETLMATGMASLLLVCFAGAIWTASWSLRFGLAPRPPLSAFQSLARFLIVTLALLFWRRRTDMLERSALACTIIAAGSSGLYGFGLNSITLQVVRLLFHFLAYSLGVVAINWWFRAKRMQSHTLVKVAA